MMSHAWLSRNNDVAKTQKKNEDKGMKENTYTKAKTFSKIIITYQMSERI